MTMMTRLGDVARSPGDPSVLARGPSSQTTADRSARALGWASIALGLAEMLAAPAIARLLQVEGRENVIRAMGAREVASGVLTLSVDARKGLTTRLIGDAVDAAALLAARRSRDDGTGGLDGALGMVAAIAVADALCLRTAQANRSPARGALRDYSQRSGLPRGVAASRGLARVEAAAGQGG